MIRKSTTTQLTILANYFMTIAAAWFTAGVIAPFFATVAPFQRILFIVSGSAMSYIFLLLAWEVAREVNWL